MKLNQLNSPFLLIMTMSMLISTLMIISSTNWIMVWMAMELNMMSFIPLIMQDQKTNQMEASIKYFLIQALSSNILIMAALTTMLQNLNSMISSTALMMSLLIKLGMSPFHHWYASMMSSISWYSCFLLSTWQKVGPLFVLVYMCSSNQLVMVLAALNSLLGGYMGMNQSSLRVIMAYSSISHLGWVLALLSAGTPVTSTTYFMMYIILTIPLFTVFGIMDMKSTLSINQSHPMNWFIPPALLSLSGIPPFSGFVPKWMALSHISESPVMMLAILIGSIMSAYFYLTITFSFFTNTWKYMSIKKEMHSPMLSSVTAHIIMVSAMFTLFIAPSIMVIM